MHEGMGLTSLLGPSGNQAGEFFACCAAPVRLIHGACGSRLGFPFGGLLGLALAKQRGDLFGFEESGNTKEVCFLLRTDLRSKPELSTIEQRAQLSGSSSNKPAIPLYRKVLIVARVAAPWKACIPMFITEAIWAAFPPGKIRDYCEWINEAKTDATRDKRIAQALDWIGEGKGRNWKYEKK